jgi:hypothetical protein
MEHRSTANSRNRNTDGTGELLGSRSLDVVELQWATGLKGYEGDQ